MLISIIAVILTLTRLLCAQDEVPFLFDPHEFTLSCRELMHRCNHNAKGLIILRNDCYRSPTNDDVQEHVFRGDPSPHKMTGVHICKYYTCRTFAAECRSNAKGRYISILTCEHHYDHSTKLRSLVDMKCEYTDTCAHRMRQCEQNKQGWDVAVNECQEKKILNAYNQTIIQYEERCEYIEPKQWEFTEELQEYWEYFDAHDYVEGLSISKTGQSADSKMKEMDELFDEYDKLHYEI